MKGVFCSYYWLFSCLPRSIIRLLWFSILITVISVSAVSSWFLLTQAAGKTRSQRISIFHMVNWTESEQSFSPVVRSNWPSPVDKVMTCTVEVRREIAIHLRLRCVFRLNYLQTADIVDRSSEKLYGVLVHVFVVSDQILILTPRVFFTFFFYHRSIVWKWILQWFNGTQQNVGRRLFWTVGLWLWFSDCSNNMSQIFTGWRWTSSLSQIDLRKLIGL